MFFCNRLILGAILLPLSLGVLSTTFAVDIGTSAAYREQQLQSWGTSIAWFGNFLGGWIDEQAKNEVAPALEMAIKGKGFS